MKKRLSILPLVFILGCAPLARAADAKPNTTTAADKEVTKSETPRVIEQVIQTPQQPVEDAEAAKIKAEVAKRLSRKKPRVKIRLRSGGEVKGRINQAESEWFTLTEDKTGKKMELSYTIVEKVSGRGMSTGKIILIAVGVVVAVVLTLAVIVVADIADGGLID